MGYSLVPSGNETWYEHLVSFPDSTRGLGSGNETNGRERRLPHGTALAICATPWPNEHDKGLYFSDGNFRFLMKNLKIASAESPAKHAGGMQACRVLVGGHSKRASYALVTCNYY